MRLVIIFSLFFGCLSSLVVRNAVAEVTVEEVKEAVLKELRGKNSTSVDSNVFNPAMGVVLDSVFSHSSLAQGEFSFRSAELNFSANVDPFLKAYVILNGTPEGVEVEEAAFVTTRLLRGLQLRGGRYFANFGRLSKFHDHELPFVNRNESLESFMGESQADGLEITYLLPTPFFLQGTLGVANKLGAENERLELDDSLTLQNDSRISDSQSRRLSAFTYNARLFTFIPLGDNQGLDVGISEAYTPKPRIFEGAYINDVNNAERRLSGMDITYRYEPREKNVYRKLLWGTEVFHNSEMFLTDADLDLDADLLNESFSKTALERRRAWGGYSYVEAQFLRQLSAGGFYDVAQQLNDHSIKKKTFGVMANFLPSEFQRIRIQLSKAYDNQGSEQDKQFSIQWMAVIGKHAHTFKDR